MTLLRYYLFFAPEVFTAIVLVAMWSRKLQKQLPIFTAYMVFQLLWFVVVASVAFHHPFSKIAYSWVSLIGNGTVSILELGVIYILADRLVFSRFSSLPRLRVVFGGSLVTLLLAAGAISGTLSDVSARTATNLFHVIDFASGLVKAGMLFTLFLLTRTLQISWRNWLTGVALGLGVSACIDLAGASLRNYFGYRSLIPIDVVETIGFHVCVVIWLVYVFLPERAGPQGQGLEKIEIESWNQELEKIVRS